MRQVIKIVKIIIEPFTPESNDLIRKNHVAYKEVITEAIKKLAVRLGNNEDHHLRDKDFSVNTVN